MRGAVKLGALGTLGLGVQVCGGWNLTQQCAMASKVSASDWEEVWSKLQKKGWELQKHGEQKRSHYLLPDGQKDKATCRVGSYVTKLTAKDGSGRCCYRTRAEVRSPSLPPCLPACLPLCIPGTLSLPPSLLPPWISPPARHLSVCRCLTLAGFLRS